MEREFLGWFYILKSGVFHLLLSEWIRSREQRAIVESFGEFQRSVNGHATSENPSKTSSEMKSEKQSEFKLCQTVARCFSDFFDAALGIHCTSANQITWNFCCHSSQTSFRDYREYLCRYFFRNEKLNLSFTVDQPQMICRLSDIKTTWLLRGVKFFESKVDGNKWRFFYLFLITFDKNRPFSRTFCYCYSKFLYSTLFTSLLTPLCSFLIVPDCAHTESSLFSSALRFHIFSRIIPCCHLFPLFLHSLRFRFLWTPRF